MAAAGTAARRRGCGPPPQAAQRALVVAKEKAANEAKSEFMSLMCHEVRTPLNGCLASAEMLLETALQARPRHPIQDCLSQCPPRAVWPSAPPTRHPTGKKGARQGASLLFEAG